MELMMNVNPVKCITHAIAVSFVGFEVVLEFSCNWRSRLWFSVEKLEVYQQEQPA